MSTVKTIVIGIIVVVAIVALAYVLLVGEAASVLTHGIDAAAAADKRDHEEKKETEDKKKESFIDIETAGVYPPQPVDESADSYYLLDDGNDRQDLILDNLCSKSCCAPQYPVPFSLKEDPTVCKNLKDYSPSNITCSNAFQDSGCLCLRKNQAVAMSNRGMWGDVDKVVA